MWKKNIYNNMNTHYGFLTMLNKKFQLQLSVIFSPPPFLSPQVYNGEGVVVLLHAMFTVPTGQYFSMQ